MSKHTPGPWYMTPDEYGIVRSSAPNGSSPTVHPGGGYQICAVLTCAPFRENGDANARLIAAAPEMYEALKYIAESDLACGWPTMQLKARAALAKAEGRKVETPKNA